MNQSIITRAQHIARQARERKIQYALLGTQFLFPDFSAKNVVEKTFGTGQPQILTSEQAKEREAQQLNQLAEQILNRKPEEAPYNDVLLLKRESKKLFTFAQPSITLELASKQVGDNLAKLSEEIIADSQEQALQLQIDAEVADAKKQKQISAAAGAMNAVSGAIQALDEMTMGDKNFGALSEAIDTAVHGTSLMLLKSGNPYAMMAGAGLEAANFISKAGGHTTQGFDIGIDNSGYGNLGHMESKSSRAIPFFGGLNVKKMDRQIASRNAQAQLAMKAANISDEIKFEQEARMNSVDDVLRLNQIALQGGVNTNILAAKNGGNLINKYNKIQGVTVYETLPNGFPIFSFSMPSVIKAQNGARLENIKVSEDPNVVPTGALHKNKHLLDLDNITKKGIPVITVDDDSAETFEDLQEQEDSIVQHAEVEKEEVIFSIDLTSFIEDLRKKWHESGESDKKILLKAGMRLAKELIENTNDNAGLLNKV